MWKFIIGCVTISTRKIMGWLENVVGLFLMNPDRIRFSWWVHMRKLALP